MKPKAAYWRKSIKLMNLQAELSGEKQRKQKLILGMTGDRILNSTDIKRTIKKYYEQLHDNKFNHLDKMDNCLKHTN